MSDEELFAEAVQTHAQTGELLEVLRVGAKDLRATLDAASCQTRRLHCAVTELSNRAQGMKPPRRGD